MERIELLKEYLQADPQDAFLNYALALEYVKRLDYIKAISLMQGVISRDENYIGAYYQLGKTLEKTNDPIAAIEIYKKGMQVALKLNEQKTFSELKEALIQLEEDDSA